MIKELLGRVRVDKSIKPIHFSKRIVPTLSVGGKYYVSFGNNNTYPCVLTEIFDENRCISSITIEIPCKPESKNGFIDSDGKISHHWVSRLTLKGDEIGLSREEAVINTVTS